MTPEPRPTGRRPPGLTPEDFLEALHAIVDAMPAYDECGDYQSVAVRSEQVYRLALDSLAGRVSPGLLHQVAGDVRGHLL